MINRNLIQLFVVSFCLLVIAMGSTVIRGWLVQDSSIVQIRPEYVPMQFNTALCFILTAVSCWLLLHRRRLICLPVALVSLVFTGLSGIQYALDIDLGIDTIFLDPFTTVKTSHAGRMAPNTALNFFLLNAATVFACISGSVHAKTIASLATGLIVIAFSLVALLGYGAGLEGALIWGDFTAMALHTAISFILLGIALTLLGIDHSDIGNLYEIPWLPQSATGSVLVITVLMWFALQSTTSSHLQNLLDNFENELAGNIENYLEIKGRAISRMASRMDAEELENSYLFNHDAQTYLDDFYDLIGLAWVQGKDNLPYLKIKPAFQDEPNIQAYFHAGLKASSSDDNQAFYDAPPMELTNRFIRISVPTHSGDKRTGQLVALSNVENLIKTILDERQSEDYVITVFINGQQLLTYGDTADPRWRSQQVFELDQVPMNIVVQATPALVQKQQTHVPTIFLAIGLIMAFLIGTTLRLFQSSKELSLGLSEANAKLHASLREVESGQKALEEKSQALIQSNKDLENFANIAAHDLKEPLRKVKMFGERLQSYMADNLDEKGSQYLDVMVSGADRMQTLLESLLSYSRVTTKGQEFSETDLNLVLRDVSTDLAELIAENNVMLKIQALPTIKADYTQMRQLFQNLIANSIRYHKPDAQPCIEVFPEQQDCPDGKVCIAVRDNGIGFAEENAIKIFEVFQRLHTRAEYPGTGMGLAVCKRIMERHQGSIRAEGELDVGAKFILTLPGEMTGNNS